MKKKEIWIVAVVALVVLFIAYWATHKKIVVAPVTTDDKTSQVDTRVEQDSVSNLDIRNATYQIENTAVVLVDGMASTDIPNSSATDKTALLEGSAFADINADGAKDAIVLLRNDTGGSGTFYYVGAVIAQGTGQKSTNTLLLGDRVRIKEISVGAGIISVTILDRAEGEPMSTTPSVTKTLQFKLDGETLVAVK